MSGTFPGIVGLFLVDNTANIDLLIVNPLTKTNTWYKSNNGSFSSQFNTPFELKVASAAIYYSN